MMEIALTTLEGVNERVTELDTTVRQRTDEFETRFKDAQYNRAFLRARVNALFRDRPYNRRTTMLMDREAMYSREAWAFSMDMSSAIAAYILEARDPDPNEGPAEAGSSNLFLPLDNPDLTIRRRYCVDHTLLNDFEMATEGNGDPPVPDLRTMEELCQPTSNGRGGPIALIAIQATNFELKNDMIQPVQNSCQFYGLPGDDANKHLDKFLHVTQSIKVNGDTDDALRLFYNSLTLRHRDTINAAAGGTFMKSRPEECYDLIKNMTAHHNGWDTSSQRTLKAKMAKINKNLIKVLQINHQVKAVTPTCETCGDPHSYNDCPATVGQTQNVYAAGAYQGGNSYQPQGNCNLLSYRLDNYLRPLGFNQNQNQNNQNQNFQNQNKNQGNNHGIPQGNNQGRNQFFQGASHGPNPPPAYQAPAYQSSGYQAPVHQPSIPQPQVVTTTEFTNYMNNAILKNMQTNMTSLINSNLELKNMFGQFMKMKTATSSGSRTLLSNTITNPKEDLKGITTQSGTAYQGPTIPTTSSSPPKVVECETEVTKDTVPPTNNESTKEVQPPVVQIKTPIPNSEPVVAPIIEPVVAPVSAPKPNQKSSIPYPSRLHDQKLRDKANDQKEKFFQIFKDLDFNISFADALILMPKFGPTIKSLLTNKDKLFELARTSLNEHCSVVLLKKLLEKLGTPTMWNKLYLPELTPTLMTLELTDRSISRPIGVAEDVFVKVGKFPFPVDFVVVEFDAHPRVPLILGRSFLKTRKALIDVYEGELTLREHSQEVLCFSDVIVSGNPTPYYDPIVSTSSPTLTPFGDNDFLLEEVDAFLALEDDPTSPEVDHSYFDTEVYILLLEAFLNDDPLLPPLNQGMYLPQVQKELKICEAKNDKFSIDEPPEVELKDLPPHLEYAFLEGDDKLPIIIAKDLSVEEKAPLINVLKSQKQAIAWKLSNLKEVYDGYLSRYDQKTMEVFMDDLSVFGNSFGTCLSHLEKMLQRYKAKVDVIAKLPHPTTVKGIHSFLGHAGFYRRFIQDFSKIARPMTRLFEKDTLFFFSNECIEAFQTLKKKLTEAPILVAPDWDLPFKLMRDASDFAIARKPLTFSRLATMDPWKRIRSKRDKSEQNQAKTGSVAKPEKV
nr:hypothetical protein [Tanacetum cinerariifolium]